MHGDVGGIRQAGNGGRLIRYPVKSMLGEDLSTVDVTERGLAHDRRFALTDRDTGKVASAKHPVCGAGCSR